jgi:lysophospholipase L1-like esterase
MNRTKRTRGVVAALVGAVIVAGSMFGGTAATAAQLKKPPKPPPPPPAATLVIAALGDSITQAIMTCSSLTTCAANSWATGTNSTVNSVATRLKATTRYNNAVSGAKSDALLGQAQAAVAQQAQYVTIEIGANDACTPTVAGMTDPEVYAGNVSAALAELSKETGSHPKIFVASIPSLQQLYAINAGNSTARFTWNLLQVCQSMLANPSSTLPADVQRRADVQARVQAYNDRLAALCTPAINCTFDNYVVANEPFTRSDISTRDYFHPSLAGQAKLAGIGWTSSGWIPLS